MEPLFIVAPTDLKLGLIITLVGIGVVFSALVVLTIIFNRIPEILKFNLGKKIRKSGQEDQKKSVFRASAGKPTLR